MDLLTTESCIESFNKILMENDVANQQSIDNLLQEICTAVDDAFNDNENIKLFLFKFKAELPKNRQQVAQISSCRC